VNQCGCNDDYYGCVNWAAGGRFEVQIPDSCLDVDAFKTNNVTISGLSDCNECKPYGYSSSIKHYNVAAGVNGVTFDVGELEAGFGYTSGQQPDWCYWRYYGPADGSHGTYRTWSTGDCSGTPGSLLNVWLRIVLVKWDGGALSLSAWSELITDDYYIFQADGDANCCEQTLNNSASCSQGFPYAICSGGSADIVMGPQ